MVRDVFDGRILGVGSSSGVRVVVGVWERSPFGSFADAMVADATGHRVLVAPTEEVAEYVSSTYSFDEVCSGEVAVSSRHDGLRFESDDLVLDVTFGARTVVGRLLRLVPRLIAHSPVTARMADPIAARVVRGVRTYGSAGNGRREFYCATDQFAVSSIFGTWRAVALGTLAAVQPNPNFGFSSTPPQPSIVTLRTVVER